MPGGAAGAAIRITRPPVRTPTHVRSCLLAPRVLRGSSARRGADGWQEYVDSAALRQVVGVVDLLHGAVRQKYNCKLIISIKYNTGLEAVDTCTHGF